MSTRDCIPRHVAIIMDGNGRWAKNRRLPRTAGHFAGKKTVNRIVEYCAKRDVDWLTLYAFSTENWQRPEEEVSVLMNLLERTLYGEVENLKKNNIRLYILGRRENLSSSLQQAIDHAEQSTSTCCGMKLTLAVNYGGRCAIMQAAKRFAKAAAEDKTKFDECNEEHFSTYFPKPQLPSVDLLIRSSGEQRISNFLLWESAYAELYFSPTLWPDFDEKEMDAAFAFYAGRERRFGKL